MGWGGCVFLDVYCTLCCGRNKSDGCFKKERLMEGSEREGRERGKIEH